MDEAIQINETTALEIMQRAQKDPIFHIQDVQGCKTLEDYQKKIVQAVYKYDRVAIRSPHDVGKTFLMAKIVLAFGASFPGAKIITTAPTHNQVKRLLWSEIRNGWKKSKFPLGGEMLLTEWKIDDDWFAIGFTSRGEAGEVEGQGTASGFQGFHAPHMLIVFDEATGINRQIWNQAEGMMTSAHVKFVAIGNPTSRQSEFCKCFSDPAWHKMRISCFDSPNLKANNINNIEDLKDELAYLITLNDAEKEQRLNSYKVVQGQLLTVKAVVGAACKWGLTHPLFVSKILGEFPEDDDNVLVSLGMVESSQQRWDHMRSTTHAIYKDPYARIVGVDCARYGPDKTVIDMIEDDFHVKHVVIAKSSIPDIVDAVTSLMNQRRAVPREEILVDGTGLGAGVVDYLQQNINNNILRKNIIVRDMIMGSNDFGNSNKDKEDIDKQQFFNVKAKMFKTLSDSLKSDLAIMPEQIYLEQLPTIIYHFTPKGQLAIESKDDYKKRTGMGSPDESDALALANYGRVEVVSSRRFNPEIFEKAKQAKPFAPGLKGDTW